LLSIYSSLTINIGTDPSHVGNVDDGKENKSAFSCQKAGVFRSSCLCHWSPPEPGQLGHLEVPSPQLEPRTFSLKQDNYWSGFIELTLRREMKLQFKYFISHYDAPTQDYLDWEEGDFNRQLLVNLDEDNVIICNHVLMKRILGAKIRFVSIYLSPRKSSKRTLKSTSQEDANN
jgi:hypothetical protein